ncbi:MAG TPA: Flp pilus assembly complex ATPase component TadA [Magnetococcales bacterium]|nr:Flp pilus assembly complex ATPase component TadA [Magnetococcales bacterium]
MLDRGQEFDLFFLAANELSREIARLQVSLEGARLTVVDVEALAGRLGIGEGWQKGGLELLTAQLLLKRPPESHYVNPRDFQVGSGGIRGFLDRWRRTSRVLIPEVAGGGGQKVERPGRRLGDLLLDRGFITQDQLQTALAEQKRSSETLGRIVVRLGLVGESCMRDVLAESLDHESVDLAEALPQAEALAMVPKSFALRHGILPILYDREKKQMVVAMANPMNASVLDLLQARLEPGTTVSPKLAGEADVASAIDQYYGHELSVEGILRELETGEVDLESLVDPTGEFSHPMVRLVDALLTDAVKQEVSDIHIGPTAGFVRVRYRIDGVLRQIYSFHKHLLPSLLVRIKVMGGMNIAETRIPQDGYISLDVNGKKVSFRISLQPTINGENAVFRILDLRREIRSLVDLGLTRHNLEELQRALNRNMGLVLVTGPTGSGKTTTLYSMINHVNNTGINVMTLEDPVEYPMPTVLQTNVNKAVGLDYAAGIRSLLWQDPDVILVGEVHDSETANMALQAAMTGHQVLTTLHANSTLGTLPRLLNLGAHKDFLIGNINCIIAQRLVRRLCPACRKHSRATLDERRILGIEEGKEDWVYRAVGCDECFGSGYRGRLPVMEVLRVDDTFDDLIYMGAPRKDFIAHGRTLGLRTMVMDGIERVKAGVTTLDELARVVDLKELGEMALRSDHV